MTRKNTLLHYAVLAVFAIAAYWPLSSFHHATRWDSVESYFPFRYFISDCLRNGQLPLWMPYQLGGYPFYADPQSGAWYPLAWIIGGIAPYTLKSFAIEFVLSVFLGGAGMYRLVRSFDIDPVPALIAGISYSACGFYISNAEHLTWIVSAAWLPWVFWAYHSAVTRERFGYSMLTGLFLFLLLSGGYPAFITVALYLLIVFFIIAMLKRQPATARWRLLWLHSVMAIAFLAISAGTLLSWYQAFPLISRGAGMKLADIFVHPFSPRCLESLLLPFATLKDTELYGADISMRNAYMGLGCILMLPFAIGSIRKSRTLWVVGIVSIFCLAAAMGDFLPVREWLYHYVPMMDMFRFPSLFRIFFIIGLIVIAAYGFDSYMREIQRHRRAFTGLILLLIAVFGIFFAASVARYGFLWQWGFRIHTFKWHLLESSRQEHIQLQSLVQIGLLGCLLFACLYRGGRMLTAPLLVLFCAGDMVLASYMNAYGTVVAMQPRDEQEAPIVAAPRNFPVPDYSKPVGDSTDFYRYMGLLRANTSIFFKTVASDGYNTFLLNSFNRFEASAVRDPVRENPWIYFASGFATGTDKMPPASNREVRVDTPTFRKLTESGFAPDSNGSVRVTGFLPNRISVSVSTPGRGLLNLQQSGIMGWRLFVDGHEQPWITTNYTQMAGLIPAGDHQVVWSFEPPLIRPLFYATIAMLVLLITGLILWRKRLL